MVGRQSVQTGGFVSGFGRLSSESLRSLYICIAYGTSSILISLIYKALLSSYNYQAKFILLAAQQATSLLFCLIFKQYLSGVPGFEVPDIHMAPLRAALWPGLLNVANIVVGWYGMALVNIPMFLCVRRTATAIVLLTEYWIRGKVESSEIQLSVGLICAGALTAGWDVIFLHGDTLGLMYTMMNNFLTAYSHTESKVFADRFNCHGFGIVLYNAMTALPITLLGATLLGEWSYTMTFEHVHDISFWISVVIASFAGVFITYIVFLCTTVNGPLVTSITGNAKDILQTVLGALLFNDFIPTVKNVSGILVSFLGAGLFSYLKLQDSLAKGAKEAEKKGDTSAVAEKVGGGGDSETLTEKA